MSSNLWRCAGAFTALVAAAACGSGRAASTSPTVIPVAGVSTPSFTAYAEPPWPLPAPPLPPGCLPVPPRVGVLVPQLGPLGIPVGHAIVVSPDGSLAVVRDDSRDVKLFDTRTAELRAVLRGHGSRPDAASFHPTIPLLATTANGEPARLWDLRSGASLLLDAGVAEYPHDAVFAPDGHVLALLFGGRVAFVDPATGRFLRWVTLSSNRDARLRVEFSPDGRAMAAFTPDYRSPEYWSVYDVATGARLGSRPNPDVGRLPSKGVYAIALGRDGRTIASGTFEGTIAINDIATGATVATLVGPKELEALRLAGDGRYLVAGGGKNVIVFELPSGRVVADVPGGGQNVAVGRDGGTLVVRRERIGLTVVASGRRIDLATGLDGGDVYDHALTPDGTRVLGTVGHGEAALVIWDARTGSRLAASRGQTWRPHKIAWSPDGSRLLVRGGRRAIADDGVHLWDLRSGMRQLTTPSAVDVDGPFAWSADGARVAVSGRSSHVVIDVTTGALLRTLDPETGFSATRELAFAPNGTLVAAVASSFDKNELRAYDGRTFARVGSARSPVGYVWKMAFSPEGSALAVAGVGAVAVLSWPGFAVRANIRTSTRTGVAGVAWAGTGRIVTLSSDGPLEIWDASSGARVAMLESDRERIGHLAVSPAGDFAVAGGGSKGMITLYDLKNPHIVTRLAGDGTGGVDDLAWHPQSNVVAVAHGSLELLRATDGKRLHAHVVDAYGGAPDEVAPLVFASRSGLVAGDARSLAYVKSRPDGDIVRASLVAGAQPPLVRASLVADFLRGCPID